MTKPFWAKAGQFGWIRIGCEQYRFDDISEDQYGRDQVTFYYTVDGVEHGPFTSIMVSGTQPG